MSTYSQEAETTHLPGPGRLDDLRAAFGATVHRHDLDTHLRLVRTAVAARFVRVTAADDVSRWTLAAIGDSDGENRADGHGDDRALDDALTAEIVAWAPGRGLDGDDLTRAYSHDATSVLAAPIILAGDLVAGALLAGDRADRSWRDADRLVLSSVARLIAERLDTGVQALEERTRFDEMAGALAHDLRAPLASVTSAARLLGQLAPASPVSERLCEVVERADTTAGELITHLVERALVRPTGTPKARPRQRIALAPLLQRVAGVVSSARDIEVLVRCDESIELWTDPLSVLRIAQNLTDNAARHSGTDAVRIDAASTERGIEIAVEDDGDGLPPELGAWLSSTTAGVSVPKPAGLGLGLRTCVALAAELGADLRIDPAPGGRVVVRLPVRAGDVDPTPAA